MDAVATTAGSGGAGGTVAPVPEPALTCELAILGDASWGAAGVVIRSITALADGQAAVLLEAEDGSLSVQRVEVSTAGEVTLLDEAGLGATKTIVTAKEAGWRAFIQADDGIDIRDESGAPVAIAGVPSGAVLVEASGSLTGHAFVAYLVPEEGILYHRMWYQLRQPDVGWSEPQPLVEGLVKEVFGPGVHTDVASIRTRDGATNVIASIPPTTTAPATNGHRTQSAWRPTHPTSQPSTLNTATV